MTPEEFNKELDPILEKMKGILTKKGHDYAGNTDRFTNFRLCEMAGLPAWKGIVIRLGDKVSRMLQFCSTEELQVKDESIEDTLIDLANYALLCLLCYKESKLK